MEQISGEQFFLNLANNDSSKCNELLTFCKDFITGKLNVPCVQICGPAACGKSTLIKRVLSKLANQNGFNTLNASPMMTDKDIKAILPRNPKYIIIDECSVVDVKDNIICFKYYNGENYSVKFCPGVTFIFIEYSDLPEFESKVKTVNVGPLGNQEKITFSDELLAEIKNYIMKF